MEAFEGQREHAMPSTEPLPDSPLLHPAPEVHAAGAVLWRIGERGTAEVAVVHRPRYDDWSLPKGKLDPGETVPAAAVREVEEETGYRCVLGRFLTKLIYPVADGNGETVTKAVGYFSARAADGAFEPNAEVDQLAWLTPEQARTVLTYRTEIDVLDEFCSLGTSLSTMLLVRHGKAGKRHNWNGDDDLRPLTEAGMRQSAALRKLLPLFGPERVYSAPRVRCVQTVQALAADLGTEIVSDPLLSEEGYWRDPAVSLARLLSLVTDSGTPLVCSQGGVIPAVVTALAERSGLPIGEPASKKGSLWLLTFSPAAGNLGPQLIAANYLPSPLPAPIPA